ncbi:hypothetical protein AB6A40_004545 [Gnathostoma spinigerum]|uniref:Uncharacterized protein n=1 Tax=Gnathostoma spinigerum TaxID=75299 RepID=A0ABD6EF37_9BILA
MIVFVLNRSFVDEAILSVVFPRRESSVDDHRLCTLLMMIARFHSNHLVSLTCVSNDLTSSSSVFVLNSRRFSICLSNSNDCVPRITQYFLSFPFLHKLPSLVSFL